MDIEFHYYMTYLIAARAGFSPAEAGTIAQAAQEVDDNHIPIAVSSDTPQAYENAISQTMNILQPIHNERIYPIFHFIPGDPEAPTAVRKDGLMSAWNTTPGSPLAHEMLDTALASGSLYRIGASAHAFADTWAHQNFLGKDDAFNEMIGESLAEKIEGLLSLMRIGHALAGHRPDIPGLIWTDGRLVNPTIDNTGRFGRRRPAFPQIPRSTNRRHGWMNIDREHQHSEMIWRADIGPPARAARLWMRAHRALQAARAGARLQQAILEYREGN